MLDLGRLQVGHQLGAGGQGKVFLATDPSGERFALKVMALEAGADRELILRRGAAFRLDPFEQGLIPILHLGPLAAAPVELRRQLGQVPKDALIAVSRYVPGATLPALRAGTSFTLLEGAAAVAGVASALARVPPGLAHGDVRAANVFVRPGGAISLIDPDLSRQPEPRGDLVALAALGRQLLDAGPAPADKELARQKLAGLFDELEGSAAQVPIAEAAERLAQIAISLGAPAMDVTAVLAKRVREAAENLALGGGSAGALAGGMARPSDSGPTPGQPGQPAPSPKRLPIALGLGAAGLALLAVVALLSGYRLEVRHVTKVEGAGPSLRASDRGGLYDTTGTVHYPGPIHALASGELVAAGDGMVQAQFEYSIERLALLSTRKELLWETRRPAAGGLIYLDITPGHYYLEEDRELADAGIQQDVRLVEVDLLHPLRITTTREILSSPQRRSGDRGP